MNDKDVVRAMEFVEANPDWAQKIRERYLSLCEERGQEPDEAEARAVVYFAAMKVAGATWAMIDELFTDDSIAGLMNEEFSRLEDPESKTVRADALEDAVAERMIEQMIHYYPRIRNIPEE